MWQINGSLKKSLGRNVNMAILVRKIGKEKYRYITHHYWGNEETFWKWRKNTYELHEYNNHYQKGEVHIQYLEVERGRPVSMGDLTSVSYPPNVLQRLMAKDHVEGAVRSALGSNVGWLIPVMALTLGIFIGFVTHQYLPAITNAVSPTPTPHPMVMYP